MKATEYFTTLVRSFNHLGYLWLTYHRGSNLKGWKTKRKFGRRNTQKLVTIKMKSHRKFLQPPFQRKPVNAYATERKKGQETKTKNKKQKTKNKKQKTSKQNKQTNNKKQFFLLKISGLLVVCNLSWSDCFNIIGIFFWPSAFEKQQAL